MKADTKLDIGFAVAYLVMVAVAMFAGGAEAAQVQRIQLFGYDVPAYTQAGLVNICVVQFDRNNGEETALTAYEYSCADIMRDESEHWLELYSSMYGAVSISVTINGVSLSTI